MGMEVELLTRPGIPGGRTLVFDLVRDGLIASDGSLEDVSVVRAAEGFDVSVVNREGQPYGRHAIELYAELRRIAQGDGPEGAQGRELRDRGKQSRGG